MIGNRDPVRVAADVVHHLLGPAKGCPIRMPRQLNRKHNIISYVSPEQRVPQDHPLRSLRAMTDEAWRELQPQFNQLYAKTGRPSIAPEKLLRALLLQALYSARSERMLMEQLDYNLLFRWFVGLNMDDSVSDVTVFTKNHERLHDGGHRRSFLPSCLRKTSART